MTVIRRLKGAFLKAVWGRSHQRGFTMVEALVGLAILGIAFVAVLAGMSTAVIAAKKADKRVTAESLAMSQMEYTKSQAFQEAPATYQAFSPLPAGYSVSAEATSIPGYDGDIQKVVVTVSYEGQTVKLLEDLKVNR